MILLLCCGYFHMKRPRVGVTPQGEGASSTVAVEAARSTQSSEGGSFTDLDAVLIKYDTDKDGSASPQITKPRGLPPLPDLPPCADQRAWGPPLQLTAPAHT